jgi:hypothetical protein
MPAFAVAAAYRFVDLPDAATLRVQWFDSAQAAATGEIVAALIADRTPPVDVAPHAPGRFR